VKPVLKWIWLSLTFVAVLPAGLLSLGCHKLFRSPIFFDLFAQFFSIVPGFIGGSARTCFYKQTLAESHMDLNMGFGSFISKIDTRVGRGVFINGRNIIGWAEIGDGAVIANHVTVLSGSRQHNFEDPNIGILEREGVFVCVKIGRDVFLGDQCVVMADIGEKSIVGSGTVVVKPIPPYSVAVGNPATVIRDRRQTGPKTGGAPDSDGSSEES